MEHRVWRSRGYLPHCDAAGLIQHLVFGLADAFPDEADAPTDAEARARWREAALDSGRGEKLLTGAAAEIVEGALLHFDRERYALLAWCVMPNHVHALLAMHEDWPLDRVVHAIKSFTANRINALLGRSGRLWRREYYDHYIRDDGELGAGRRLGRGAVSLPAGSRRYVCRLEGGGTALAGWKPAVRSRRYG